MVSLSASFGYYTKQCFLFDGFGQPDVTVDGYNRLNIESFEKSIRDLPKRDLPKQSKQPNIGGVRVTINVINQARVFSAGIDGVYLPRWAVRIKQEIEEKRCTTRFTLTAIGRILLGIYRRLFGIQPYIYIRAPRYAYGIEDKEVLYQWIMALDEGTFGIIASLVPKNQF